MSTPYRGYIIEVRTPGRDDAWRALINIEKHTDAVIDGARVPVTDVSTTAPIPHIFKTEVEALEAGLFWGRKMVDERLAEHSINLKTESTK